MASATTSTPAAKLHDAAMARQAKSTARPMRPWRRASTASLASMNGPAREVRPSDRNGRVRETSGSFSRNYFDGRAAIDNVREFYEAVSQDQGIEIQCRGKGEVYAEPVLFRRALINLITNALRFTPSGGSVTVALERRSNASAVSVSDTGCGISSQQVPQVFNRFFRGDPARTAQGTGLGLAIVKSIMQIHDGDVSVASELNKGTVVTLTFPDAQTNGAAAPS